MLNITDQTQFEEYLARIEKEENDLRRYIKVFLKEDRNIVKKLRGHKDISEERLITLDGFLRHVSTLIELVRIEHLGTLNKWQYGKFEKDLSWKTTKLIKYMHELCHISENQTPKGELIDIYNIYEGLLIEIHVHISSASIGEEEKQKWSQFLYVELIQKHHNPLQNNLNRLQAMLSPQQRRESIAFWNKEVLPMLMAYLDLLVQYTRTIIDIERKETLLGTNQYSIENHLVKEFSIRVLIKNLLEGKEYIVLPCKTYSYHFLRISSSFARDWFTRNRIGFGPGISFDETSKQPSHYSKMLEFIGKVTSSESWKGKTGEYWKIIYDDLQERLKEMENLSNVKAAVSSGHLDIAFFNKGDFAIVQESTIEQGKFQIITDERKFCSEVLPFLVYERYHKETMYDPSDAIVEPPFLSLMQRIKLHKYNTGLEVTKQVITEMVEKACAERSIGERNKRNIQMIVDEMCNTVKRLQEILMEKLSRREKNIKYHKFIDDPFLVYKTLVFLIKLAIFSESRSMPNAERHIVSMGRNNGFIGTNNVAVHGYNNHLKFLAILRRVEPYLKAMDTELGIIFEFQSLVTMLLHDSATYDLQNVIPKQEEDEYFLKIKAAHKKISSYIIVNMRYLQKLLECEIDPEKPFEKIIKDDLSLMAAIAAKHDYSQLHFDIENNGTSVPELQKYLVMISASGIADNSAGIAFLDDDGKVKIDPWEEKGADIFSVPGNGKIFGAILSNLSEDSKYYDKRNAEFYSKNHLDYEMIRLHAEKFVSEIPERLEYTLNGRRYNFRQNMEGLLKSGRLITEWQLVCYKLCLNVLLLEEGCTRNKLIAGLTRTLTFNQADSRSDLLSTDTINLLLGVFNAGYMRLPQDCYDGKMLTIEIHMDSEFMSLMFSHFQNLMQRYDDFRERMQYLEQFLPSYGDKNHDSLAGYKDSSEKVTGADIIYGRISKFFKEYVSLNALPHMIKDRKFIFPDNVKGIGHDNIYEFFNVDKNGTRLDGKNDTPRSIGLRVLLKFSKGVLSKCLLSSYSKAMIEEIKSTTKSKDMNEILFNYGNHDDQTYESSYGRKNDGLSNEPNGDYDPLKKKGYAWK
jgi:hypothetical protein